MKKKTVNLWLILALIVLAAISFGPCVEVTKTAIIDHGDIMAGDYYLEYESYLPGFFCIVSALELLLAVFPKRRWLRGLGIVLHLFKLGTPILLMRSGVFGGMGGLYGTSYALSWLGWILMAVGAGVLGLYIWDLLKA